MIHRLDGISQAVGRFCGWLCLILVLITVEQVIARYLFQGASIAVQELQWHLFGAIFSLSMAWSLKEDQHVRVDLFHDRFSPGIKNGIEVFGLLFFVLPMAMVLILYGWDDVMTSRGYTNPYPVDRYSTSFGQSGDFLYGLIAPIESLARESILVGETSPMSSGLEARWIPKALIPLGGLLLAVQAILQILKIFIPQKEPEHGG